MGNPNRSVTMNGYTVPNNSRSDHYFTGICRTGKRSYLLRTAAKKAAKAAAKVGFGNMRAYQCKYCNYWHVGHATEYNPRYTKTNRRGEK